MKTITEQTRTRVRNYFVDKDALDPDDMHLTDLRGKVTYKELSALRSDLNKNTNIR